MENVFLTRLGVWVLVCVCVWGGGGGGGVLGHMVRLGITPSCG